MDRLTRSQSVGLLALLVVITGIVAASVFHSEPASSSGGIVIKDAGGSALETSSLPPLSSAPTVAPARSADIIPPDSSASSLPTNAASAAEVVVHVAGAVRKPGVYHLKQGARNDDALKAAGGPSRDANTDSVNLAARAEDGTQLFIPTRQQSADRLTNAGAFVGSVEKAAKQKPKRGLGGSAPAHSGRSSRSDKLTDPHQGQIDLNTADADSLQRIPGVGPAMAARLLAYRKENHGFHSVEDLMQVTGIGEKKFEKMKDFVTVSLSPERR